MIEPESGKKSRSGAKDWVMGEEPKSKWFIAVASGISAAVSVAIPATWFIASMLNSFEERLEALRPLPDRVAKLEVSVGEIRTDISGSKIRIAEGIASQQRVNDKTEEWQKVLQTATNKNSARVDVMEHRIKILEAKD